MAFGVSALLAPAEVSDLISHQLCLHWCPDISPYQLWSSPLSTIQGNILLCPESYARLKIMLHIVGMDYHALCLGWMSNMSHLLCGSITWLTLDRQAWILLGNSFNAAYLKDRGVSKAVRAQAGLMQLATQHRCAESCRWRWMAQYCLA